MIRLKLFIITILYFGALISTAAPKYIFYFIGDGMGQNHVTLTENYRRNVLGCEDSLLMRTFPYFGVVSTYSASSPVTDSAAAGTALSSGKKTNNRTIGISPENEILSPVSEQLHDRGYGVGLVTSVAIDDATPAAFYAHVSDRGQFDQIARDAAKSGFEFLGGANLRGENTSVNDFVSSGYNIDTPDNSASPVRKVLLLNNVSNLPNDIGYAIDTPSMSLYDMTEQCLGHLMKVTPENFFMMVEGGSIDHAAHANDGATVVKEIIDFNNALKIAYDFYTQHPAETIIIVTADHDTGGMALINSGGNPKYINYQKMSKDRFNEMCLSILNDSTEYDLQKFPSILQDNFGIGDKIVLTSEENEELYNSFAQTFEKKTAARQSTYSKYTPVADTLFSILNRKMNIGWVTDEHTANPVAVYAIGNGAEVFNGQMDNVDIPVKLIELIYEEE